MFIRVKAKPNSKVSIQIVESYRAGNKVTQKIITHVGVAEVNDEKMIAGLKSLAQIKIDELLKERQLQTELFCEIEPAKLGRKPKKELKDILPPEQVSLADIKEEKRIVEGVDDIGGAAYDALGYDNVLPRGANQLLKDIVLARLVYPYSKHRLWQVLFDQFDKKYDLNQFYRLMDQIHPRIDKIKEITGASTQSLLPTANVVLFDVTTLHFETIEQDKLREFGYSKNFRFNTTQVVLALATNEHGMPIGYELFKGNEAEVNTLIVSIKRWEKLFKIDSVCFVGDRAMFSKENIGLMEEKGYKYVIAAKLRAMSDKLQEEILNEKNYRIEQFGDEIGWVGKFDYRPEFENIKIKLVAENNTVDTSKMKVGDAIIVNGLTPHLYYQMYTKTITITNLELQELLTELSNKKIKLKEFKIKIIQLIIKNIASTRTLCVTYKPLRARNDNYKRDKILDSLKSKTGKAEKLLKNGAKRYVKVEAGTTSLDLDKIADDKQWDGMHGIISNIDGKPVQELLAQYHSLWHIEEAFRINKHNLKMRPIYHWTEKRIESHVALCYMTFAVLKRIQYQVELTQIRYSPQDVMEVMLNIQSSIHVHKKTGDRYRIPGAVSNNARCVYRAFGLNRSQDATVYLP